MDFHLPFLLTFFTNKQHKVVCQGHQGKTYSGYVYSYVGSLVYYSLVRYNSYNLLCDFEGVISTLPPMNVQTIENSPFLLLRFRAWNKARCNLLLISCTQTLTFTIQGISGPPMRSSYHCCCSWLLK